MKNLYITLALLIVACACQTVLQTQSITPSKKYITKELPRTGEFHAISVSGSPDVEYRQSNDASSAISISGPDNLVDLLEVAVENGTLQVNFKKNIRITGGEYRLKVIASSPSLREVNLKGSADIYLQGDLKGTDLKLDITGSGDIEAENLQYDNITMLIKGSGDIDAKEIKTATLKASISGSGDIDLKGAAQKATLSVSGSGDISADRLTASHVTASISGSGDISCHASDHLDAKITGSGNIRYKGNPATLNKQGRTNSISEK